MYPLDEIRERCDIVEIVSEHVALKQNGRKFTGLCPFHSEKTPSFHVDPERKFYKCFGCGEGGDVFSFVQKIENVSFSEAVEILAKRYGVQMRISENLYKNYSKRERLAEINSLAADFFALCLTKHDAIKKYLEKRNLTDDVVNTYKIGYAPDSWRELTDFLISKKIKINEAIEAGLTVKKEDTKSHYYDRFRNRLIFPIINTSGKIIAFGGRVMDDRLPKYLNSPETLLFAKNKTLYGLNIARRAIKPDGFLIITEGYMDVIAAHSAGYQNTVATLGTALTPEHVTLISRFTKKVVLAFDADSAGIKAALKSAPLFENAGFNARILVLPKGEDPDSLINSGNEKKFAQYIKNALPLADFKIKLVLANYDKKSDANKAEALKDALEVVTEVQSVIDRERLIGKLVPYHPNFSSGTTVVEEQLRGEVKRMIPKNRSSSKTAKGTIPVKKINLILNSELLILSLILMNGIETAKKVFEYMSPDDFSTDETASLAKIIYELTDCGSIDIEQIRQKATNTPASKLLIDLIMSANPEKMQCSILEPIDTIKKYKMQDRIKYLSKKIQSGEIELGSELWNEYWSLLKSIKI